MLYPVLQDPLHQIVSSLFDRPRGASIGQMLFGAGEQGGWYDVADLSTLFQDSAGATPVTAVEQPVGRILDKSGRGNHATQATTTKRPLYSRRVNLLVNSEFTGYTSGTPGTGPTNWIVVFNGGEVLSAPRGIRIKATTGRHFVEQTFTTSATVQTYLFACEVDVVSGTNLSGFIEVAGTPAGGKVYYIDGAVVTTATPVTEGRHLLSVAVTTNGTAGYIGFRAGVGTNGNNTGDIIVITSSVVLATDAHLPYQRVNTATDYDADPAKFPAYLRFDGVDDALQTANIDFTSTDKMTVWAGVTKLSDAALGMMMELSQDININPGSFYITAPEPNGEATFRFKSRGSVNTATVAVIGNAAPITRLVTAVADIAGDVMTITAGATVSSSADQGGGNYGNYPLYIGARAGTSLFFNGRLYSLIVRGAQTTLSQIEATELYIKQKMRLP